MTLIEVLRRATGYLEQHGSGSPRLDAEVLLAHALGLRRLDLYLQFERLLSETELEPYRELIARRGKSEPVAYLVGHKEFMGLEFEVGPEVLVPNPDTEVLVQLAVTWGRERARPLRIADVGTGSGCIAVALAHFLPEAELFATDVSPEAVALARRNADRHGLSARVHVSEGDLLAALPSGLDAICANLPYVRTGADVDREVLAQPSQALFAGPRGSELVLRLLEEAPARLKEGGAVFTEIDALMLDLVLPPAERLYQGVRIEKDLGGHERVLVAWKS